MYSFACLVSMSSFPISFFFFFNDTATTEIYTLSLHDALPISKRQMGGFGSMLAFDLRGGLPAARRFCDRVRVFLLADRKSTRLNSSHVRISYAVFCLKKKNKRRFKSHA